MIEIPASGEQILYEQADEIPGFGAVTFVTALSVDEARGTFIRESHVFVRSSNCHLHEIGGMIQLDHAQSSRSSVMQATHQLFASYVKAKHQADGRGVSCAMVYATRILPRDPFQDFRRAGLFSNALWEIQDWTMIAGLRESLARASC